MEYQIILKYFSELNDLQKTQFSSLYLHYEFWNSKINVISRKDLQYFYERHVLHSLAPAKLLRFQNQTHLLDLGTGGGFPGIPLAILFPNAYFTLVDSVQKKIKVVNDIIEKLALKNAIGIVTRAENVTEKFDFVLVRSVAKIPTLYQWTKNNINPDNNNSIQNGLILLKGGDLTDEIGSFKKSCSVHHLSNYFIEPWFATKKIVHLPISK